MRINKTKKEILLNYAIKNASIDPAIIKAEDKAYKKALRMVTAGIVKEYGSDIEILKKYNMAVQDRCINIQLSRYSSMTEIFNFKTKEETPFIAKNESCRYRKKTFLLSEECGDAVSDYVAKAKSKEEAETRKKLDFEAIVNTATTFDQLTAAWKGFESARELVEDKTMILVNDEVKARVASYTV